MRLSARRIVMLEAADHMAGRSRQAIEDVCVTVPVLPQRIPMALVFDERVQEFVGQNCILDAVSPQGSIDGDDLPLKTAKAFTAVTRYGAILQHHPKSIECRYIAVSVDGNGLQHVFEALGEVRGKRERLFRPYHDGNPINNKIRASKIDHLRARAATMQSGYSADYDYLFHAYSIPHPTQNTKPGGVK